MLAQELAIDQSVGSFTSESKSYLCTCKYAQVKSTGISAMTSWDLSLAVSPINLLKNVGTAYNKLLKTIRKILAFFLFTLITTYWRIRLKAI